MILRRLLVSGLGRKVEIAIVLIEMRTSAGGAREYSLNDCGRVAVGNALRSGARSSCGRQGLRAHRVRLVLKRGVIVQRNPAVHLPRGRDAALSLLHDVPSLVRQMLFLSRRDIDLGALSIGQGVDLGGS